MMKPPEQVGAVPQQGVNPQARDVPQPADLSADDMDYFRHDPEIIAAVESVVGKKIDMSRIPDQMLVGIAGMVQKLGAEGAVAEFLQKTPPQVLQQIRQVKA